MKRLPLWPVLCGLAFAPQAFAAGPATSTWEMDPAHSTIGFSAKHMMITNVQGQFEAGSAVLSFDDKDPSKSTVEVVIETKSVDTNNEKRDEHLKSPDFFDAEKFPQITFKSTKITKKGKADFEVAGDLTIHGVTKPVKLKIDGPSAQIKDPWGNTRIGLNASTKINRKDFGLVWNKTLEAGGVVVSDEIKIEIAAEFQKKEAKKDEAPAAPAAPTAAPVAPVPAQAPAAK